MTMIAEGAEAKRQEDALVERKRKAEEKERWEGASVSSFARGAAAPVCGGGSTYCGSAWR